MALFKASFIENPQRAIPFWKPPAYTLNLCWHLFHSDNISELDVIVLVMTCSRRKLSHSEQDYELVAIQIGF